MTCLNYYFNDNSKNKILAMLIIGILVTCSMFFHLNERKHHFQETDSSLVYEILKNKPNPIVLSNASSFQSEFLFDKENFLSNIAFKFLNVPDKLNKIKKRKLSEQELKIYRNSNIIRIIRVGILFNILNLNLPRPVKFFFYLAFINNILSSYRFYLWVFIK